MKNSEKKIILEKNKNVNDFIAIVEGNKIISKDVNNKNQLIYIVEDEMGKRDVKLYNEIDQNIVKEQLIINDFFDKEKKI